MRDGRRQVSWQNLAVCGMSHSGDVYGQAFSGGDQARETITLDARRLLYGYPDVTVSWDEDPTYPLRQWFADLSEAEQAAAEQLGWDAASWDEGGRALGAALAAAKAGKLAETPSGNLVVPPDLVAAANSNTECIRFIKEHVGTEALRAADSSGWMRAYLGDRPSADESAKIVAAFRATHAAACAPDRHARH